MSIDATSDRNATRASLQQQIAAFKNGDLTLTKDALEKVVAKFGPDSPAQQLLSDYDNIDIDGNGISFDELKTYAKATTRPKDLKGVNDGEPKRVPGQHGASMTLDELKNLQSQLSPDDKDYAALSQVISDFSSVDADADGSVTRDEMGAYYPAGQSPGGGAGPAGAVGPRPITAPARGGRAAEPMTLEELTKLQGKLSTDDDDYSSLGQVIADFSKIDSDSDGKVSRDEMLAFYPSDEADQADHARRSDAPHDASNHSPRRAVHRGAHHGAGFFVRTLLQQYQSVSTEEGANQNPMSAVQA